MHGVPFSSCVHCWQNRVNIECRILVLKKKIAFTGYDALFAGTKKNRPPINENSKVLIIGASGGTGTPGNFYIFPCE